MVYCTKCGFKNEEGALNCTQCGKPLEISRVHQGSRCLRATQRPSPRLGDERLRGAGRKRKWGTVLMLLGVGALLFSGSIFLREYYGYSISCRDAGPPAFLAVGMVLLAKGILKYRSRR